MLTLRDIKGVGNATEKKLNDLGINSVFEVFSFLPRKYIDLQKPIRIWDAEVNQLCLLEGTVEKVSEVSKTKTRSFWVTFSDNLCQSRCFFRAMFYNMPFLHDSFQVGDSYRLLTRLQRSNDFLMVVNPQLEKIEKISKLDGIYTVYPLSDVMGQNAFKNIVYSALDTLKSLEYEGRLASINKDLSHCFELAHRPTSLEIADRAVNSLASIDLAITLSIYRKLFENGNKTRKVFYNFADFRMDNYISALNFTPTQSQLQAFDDIYNDMASQTNMSRIVSGDVGSGKTAVSFFAMCLCACANKQAVLMAPTEILAKQHAKKFEVLANKLNVNFALLTSSTSSAERKRILNDLANGNIDVLIGTNSVISDDVIYNGLSLAVIDEQHRFGVNTRAMLEHKGAVDILSLTATPIPRSMALTFYENIAISKIEKRADAKTNVKTLISNNLTTSLQFLYDRAKEGKQSFIVCPSIVDAEGNNLTSIETFLRDYSHIFDGVKLAVIHGKLSNAEKESVMHDFVLGKFQVLVATSVIEVGIDTKATEILVINADRFGLASLHQLRGRVGRDGSEAHCLLYSSSKGEKATERLNTLAKSNDGAYLAEVDFAMRGAGDFIGVKQSGRSLTPLFGLQVNAQVLTNAKSYADSKLCDLSLRELLSLTRQSASKVRKFIDELNCVTLNS